MSERLRCALAGFLLVTGCGGNLKDAPTEPDGSGGSASGGAGGSGALGVGGAGGGGALGVGGAAAGGPSVGGSISFDGVTACSVPPDVGPCKSAMQRFYYDGASRSCEPFIYGGCGGNDNNYESAEGCERFCIGHLTCRCASPAAACTVTRECAECTVDLDGADGTACGRRGLHCSNGATLCDCKEDGDAGVDRWTCGRKL